MKLSRERTAFGRHETFPLRHAWLTKGAEAILAYPTIFSEPERAMVELGVGRNMVSAMQYWLQVTGVVAVFHDAGARLTPLGETILGDAGDPYLEDEATLWIIHWLIASNAELATGFFWFFNRFAMPRFGEPELRQTLTDFVERELGITRAQTTLKSDLSTLLRLYAPALLRGAGEPAAKGGGARRQRLGEEQLDALLAGLRLIEHEPGPGGGYRSPRRARPYLPPIALAFALAERFAAEPEMPALPIRQLLYGDPNTLGWAAPGAVFRLSEDGFMAVLAHVMEGWPGCYELRDTAGVHQLYRLAEPPDALRLLVEYYRRDAAR
ncbi:MAG: DUF4007 family protein [Chromatiaceae bacterium]|nr:DUF4007 family protein [Chromatiaceae bacterium]